MDMFDKLVWEQDRVLLDDLVFHIEHYGEDTRELSEDYFALVKERQIIGQYADFWSKRSGFSPKNIFELGIWDGGSVAFWFELFHPQKHVAVDFSRREDGRYFRRYVDRRKLAERVSTYWGVDQADGERLKQIAASEFAGPLDLVIDDASHQYRATKSSFETLFPLLRQGGLYIIEDWSWGHWKEFQSPSHPWSRYPALTRLMIELLEATGTSNALISNLTFYQGFAVVERGEAPISDPSFELDDHIIRRPERVSRRKRILERLIR